MSRPKDRYLATLASGYGLMALQIVLTLAQVPLALKYLGKEDFGMWSLAVQVATWLLILDGGMNGALSRHLIDYRLERERDDSNLRKCISTGFRILLSQGLLIFLITLALAFLAGPLFELSPEDSKTFGSIITVLGIATCLNFLNKIVTSWLFAAQRLEMCNLISLATLLAEFVLFWILLHAGYGLYSLAWARLFQTALNCILIWWVGIGVSAFPYKMLTGAWDTGMMRVLATYGGGMFVITLGNQLLNATQTAMVTKHLGLTTAAIWATAPKLFQVVLQMVSKFWDYRAPHLSLLMAGHQQEPLTRDFDSIFRMTAYLGGGGLGAVVAMNEPFLAFWTNGAIHWEPINSYLIAFTFYLALLSRCFTDFVLQTKKVGWMPFLILVEGTIFVFVASWALKHHGIPGMLVTALLTGCTFRFPYAWKYFRSYLNPSVHSQALLFRHAAGGLALGLLVFALITGMQYCTKPLPPWGALFAQGLAASAVMAPIAFHLIVLRARGSLDTPSRA